MSSLQPGTRVRLNSHDYKELENIPAGSKGTVEKMPVSAKHVLFTDIVQIRWDCSKEVCWVSVRDIEVLTPLDLIAESLERT